jgi:hypothetical protein
MLYSKAREILGPALTFGVTMDSQAQDPVIGFKAKAATLGGRPLLGKDPLQKREAEQIRAEFIDYFDDKDFAAKCIALLPKAVQWRRVALQGFLVFESKAKDVFFEMAEVDRRLEDMRYNASKYSDVERLAVQDEAGAAMLKMFDLSNGIL